MKDLLHCGRWQKSKVCWLIGPKWEQAYMPRGPSFSGDSSICPPQRARFEPLLRDPSFNNTSLLWFPFLQLRENITLEGNKDTYSSPYSSKYISFSSDTSII